MVYLVEILLFLLPFAAFWLWRRSNPNAEPSTVALVVAALAVAAGIGGAIWYGLSRSADRNMIYVAPSWDTTTEEIEPGRAEPGRPAPPQRAGSRPLPSETRRSDMRRAPEAPR